MPSRAPCPHAHPGLTSRASLVPRMPARALRPLRTDTAMRDKAVTWPTRPLPVTTRPPPLLTCDPAPQPHLRHTPMADSPTTAPTTHPAATACAPSRVPTHAGPLHTKPTSSDMSRPSWRTLTPSCAPGLPTKPPAAPRAQTVLRGRPTYQGPPTRCHTPSRCAMPSTGRAPHLSTPRTRPPLRVMPPGHSWTCPTLSAHTPPSWHGPAPFGCVPVPPKCPSAVHPPPDAPRASPCLGPLTTMDRACLTRPTTLPYVPQPTPMRRDHTKQPCPFQCTSTRPGSSDAFRHAPSLLSAQPLPETQPARPPTCSDPCQTCSVPSQRIPMCSDGYNDAPTCSSPPRSTLTLFNRPLPILDVSHPFPTYLRQATQIQALSLFFWHTDA